MSGESSAQTSSQRTQQNSMLSRLINMTRRSILPATDQDRHALRLWIFRILAVANLTLGTYYLLWRYTSSLNLGALWFALGLVLAETYSLIDTALFAFMMWKPPRRGSPPPLEGVSVDVFITTYNEPLELVHLTAEAARSIRWPDLRVYLLDDGSRLAVQEMAQELGIGYISRGEVWDGKARHAKAGNVNNALLETSGEFILILDADQIPSPQIVERTVGYFRDPKLAFVQTPQYFYNLPKGDPFGSDAPLFYGPIQQGKDGWNAAFFCGSNALLRREALLQLGLTGYVEEMENRTRSRVAQLGRELNRFRPDASTHRQAMSSLRAALEEARQSLRGGAPLELVSSLVREAVSDAQALVVRQDVDSITDDLMELAAAGDVAAAEVADLLWEERSDVVTALQQQAAPTSQTFGLTPEAVDDLDLTRSDEAIPIHSLATFSVTEDMATAMKLHAMGWQSVFHPEILAQGLAPEDLGSALSQRLRWAQGTIQVFLKQNPFLIKGLSLPQRLQYFTTMFSYFSGFVSVIYLASPIIYLLTGIPPVAAWSAEFFWRLIPFLLLNRLIFRYVAWGLSIWRGEQYSLALFPLWIQAVISVLTGAKLSFVVTPKERQEGVYLRLVWPQLVVVWLTLIAVLYGIAALAIGWTSQIEGVIVNVFWGCYNIVMLSSIIRAAVFRAPEKQEARPPSYLLPADGAQPMMSSSH